MVSKLYSVQEKQEEKEIRANRTYQRRSTLGVITWQKNHITKTTSRSSSILEQNPKRNNHGRNGSYHGSDVCRFFRNVQYDDVYFD